MQFGFGAGILTGTRNDIAGGQPIRFGALQDIDIGFDGEIKELYGQSQYALDAARGKVKIAGKAKFAQISVLTMANLFFGSSISTGQLLNAYNESQTVLAAITGATSAATTAGNAVLTFASVPVGVVAGQLVSDTTASAAIPPGTFVISKTATTVTISANVVAPGVGIADSISFGPYCSASNSATYSGDLGIFYAATGAPLTYVTGAAPAVGQYTESNGVYSFNAADVGKSVLLNYLWTSSTTGFTIAPGNPLMGITPKFAANFNNAYGGNSLNLQLFSCVSNKLSLPTKIDDYIIQEFDFMAYANAAGQTFSLSASS